MLHHLVLVSAGVPPADPLSRMMRALKLDRESSRDQQGETPLRMVQLEGARDRHTPDSMVPGPGSGPAAGPHHDLCTERPQSQIAAGVDHIKVSQTKVFQQVLGGLISFFLLVPFQMASHLPPDQASIFISLMTMEGRSFIPGDVMEAVQLNRDFPSALKFLTHSCPICQEQVSFSKVGDASSVSTSQRPDNVIYLLSVCTSCRSSP